MPDEIKQLIFVASLIIILFLIVLLIIKLKSNKHYYNKNKKNKTLNKKIRKYSRNRDFLFLSDVFLPVENNQAVLIDNIIFGNKYIYVIAQKHWEGQLKGFEYDTKWMISTKNVTKYVDNPLIGNRFKVRMLLNFLNEPDEDNVINIIALNNKTKFQEIQVQPLESIVSMTNLFKLIDEFERNSPLNDIKEEEIEKIANMIYQESIRIAKTQKGWIKNVTK